MSTTEITVPTEVSKNTPVILTVGTLIAVVSWCSVFYSRLTTAEALVARQGAEIAALQVEARNTRDSLVRIDTTMKNVEDYLRELRARKP